jgi:hypothetical protein
MLWTVFEVLFVVWMLQMVLQFGAGTPRLVLVVSACGAADAADQSSHLFELRRTPLRRLQPANRARL